MKIVYIVGAFPKVVNTFTLQESIQLMEMGHKIIVLAINKSNESITNADVAKIEKNVYYLDDYLSSNHFRLTKNIDRASRRVGFMSSLFTTIGKIMTGTNNVLFEKYFRDFSWKILGFETVANKFKQQGVDIIHGTFGNREASLAMALSDLTGIPFTFETHARDLYVNFSFGEEKIRKAKKIFTISHYNKRHFVDELNCQKSKLVVKRVLYNKEYCDKIFTDKKEDNILVAVCRLAPIKGLEYALQAFKQLLNKRPNLKFLIIGDGELGEKLKRQAKQLSIENQVKFLGNMSNENALNIVSTSTIALLPSVIAEDGDRDGVPTSLIEAMYLGVPAVSSIVSGIPELIEDGINGFLAEQKNVEEIVKKTEALLSNVQQRLQMGAESRKKVIKEFNFEENSIKLLSAWKGIVDDTHNGGPLVDNASADKHHSVVPKVSVVTTVYNAEKYIAIAIESILTQTLSDLEYIIVNDGSIDGTKNILDKITDPRLKIFNVNRMGRQRALNYAVSRCQGEYIAILDADDVSQSTRLAIQADYLEKHAKVGLIGAAKKCLIDDSGKTIEEIELRYKENTEIKENLIKTNPIFHSSVMYRRAIYNKVQGYDESLIGFEDWDFYIRISPFCEIVNYPENFSYKRLHTEQFFDGKKNTHRSKKAIRARATIILRAIKYLNGSYIHLFRAFKFYLKSI